MRKSAEFEHTRTLFASLQFQVSESALADQGLMPNNSQSDNFRVPCPSLRL